MAHGASGKHLRKRSPIPRRLLLALLGSALGCHGGVRYHPRTRTYYVRAEPVEWSYAPQRYDSVMGQPLPAPWGGTLVYHRSRYIGYTDSTFTTPSPRPSWLGILGPLLRAIEGDTIRVVFRNATALPLSIHPHGVRYSPENEGAVYNPPRGGGDRVPPGGHYTYA